MILRGVITWQNSFWELFSRFRKNLCHFAQILCLSHKISKIFILKIFSKKSYFCDLRPILCHFCVNFKKIFFWPKKIFVDQKNYVCDTKFRKNKIFVWKKLNFKKFHVTSRVKISWRIYWHYLFLFHYCLLGEIQYFSTFLLKKFEIIESIF